MDIRFPLDISRCLLKNQGLIFRKCGLKWVAVARIGLKLGGNEAIRFRIMFKPDLCIKNQAFYLLAPADSILIVLSCLCRWLEWGNE